MLAYTHHTLNATPVKNASMSIEELWVHIQLCNHDSLLFGCAYRSPNSTAQENITLNESPKNMCSGSHSHILICGDFNYPKIDWSSMTTSENQSIELLETIRDCYLFQHKQPTRARVDERPSTLDLVFSNEEDMVDGLVHHALLGKSDHSVLPFIFRCYLNFNTAKLDICTIRETTSA